MAVLINLTSAHLSTPRVIAAITDNMCMYVCIFSFQNILLVTEVGVKRSAIAEEGKGY